MAQVAEHILGKDEVTSSNLVISSKENRFEKSGSFFVKNPVSGERYE